MIVATWGGLFLSFSQSSFAALLDNLLQRAGEAGVQELVLGTKSRSGGQWDIWEAVFSPVGSDGYPKRIWDKRTGEIDRTVAEYWRDHYDLVHIMRRDWATLKAPRSRLSISTRRPEPSRTSASGREPRSSAWEPPSARRRR